MARGLPRVGATRRVRVGTLSEGIRGGRVLLVRRREAQTSHSWKIPAAKLRSRAPIGSRVSGPDPWGRQERRKVSLGVNRLELDHGKTGNFLEIAEVQRRYLVAEMQRCRADQQILERKLDAHRFLLAFDAPR